MKKRLLAGLVLVVVVAAIGVLAGCRQFPRIVGSNTIETRDFDFDGFTRVNISRTFTAEIVKADTFSVEVTLNDNLFDYLEISRSGNTLTVTMEPLSSFIHTTQKIKISMPELVAVSLSGASQGVVTGFDTSDLLDINVSGASRLDINGLQTTGSTYIQVSGASRLSGSLETVDGDFEVSGASVLELTGSGTDIRLDVSGASQARLADFITAETSTTVSGASSVTVEVNERLDLEVTGASRLTYSGNPTLGRVEVSGASSLIRQ